MEDDEVQTAPTFSKAQMVKSKRYAKCRDLLAALLSNGKRYTFDEADKIIKDFSESKVN